VNEISMSAEGQNALGIPKRNRNWNWKWETKLYRLVGGCRQWILEPLNAIKCQL